MNENYNEQELRIAVDFNSLKTEFAGSVQIEAATDHVILNFLQVLPGSPSNQANAKIVSRIALTWPHFAQLTKMMNNTLKENQSIANDFFVQTVLQEGNINATRK